MQKGWQALSRPPPAETQQKNEPGKCGTGLPLRGCEHVRLYFGLLVALVCIVSRFSSVRRESSGRGGSPSPLSLSLQRRTPLPFPSPTDPGPKREHAPGPRPILSSRTDITRITHTSGYYLSVQDWAASTSPPLTPTIPVALPLATIPVLLLVPSGSLDFCHLVPAPQPGVHDVEHGLGMETVLSGGDRLGPVQPPVWRHGAVGLGLEEGGALCGGDRGNGVVV